MTISIRAKVDTELTNRVGTWFTYRQIQDKLRINPATLKPLIMKYAREKVLRRRKVKGTARAVEFSPAAGSRTNFQRILVDYMPYRNLNAGATRKTATKAKPAKKMVAKKSNKRTAKRK